MQKGNQRGKGGDTAPEFASRGFHLLYLTPPSQKETLGATEKRREDDQSLSGGHVRFQIGSGFCERNSR